MRLLRLGTLAVILTLGVVIGPARADDKADIRAAYGRVAQLFKKKDIDGIAKMMTPDCKMQELDGKTMTRDQWTKAMKAQVGALKDFDLVIKPGDIKAKGSAATVTTNQTIIATVTDPNGKAHKIKNMVTSLDTLVKTPQGWRLKVSKTIKESATMDGKPFNPALPSP